MKQMTQTAISLSVPIAIALAASAAAIAAQQPLPNDPKRPVDKISRDLNIKPEQFVACFAKVSPAPQGTRPTADRTQNNKAILLPCLQKANPEITNQKLDEVMDRYRPGGHEAQEPAPQPPAPQTPAH